MYRSLHRHQQTTASQDRKNPNDQGHVREVFQVQKASRVEQLDLSAEQCEQLRWITLEHGLHLLLLCNKGIIREYPKIHVGHVASGSIVGASSLFIKWLKDNRDRKYFALEMESGGILSAAHTRAVATLVIRGISDYSDIAKAELDQIKGGALRRYAMTNATLLLWALMELQLVRRVPSKQ